MNKNRFIIKKFNILDSFVILNDLINEFGHREKKMK